MGFGIKAVEKATGKVVWIFPMDDVREIILEHGSTDAFIKKLRLREKYPEAQYEIYLVTSSDEELWVS